MVTENVQEQDPRTKLLY